MSRALELSATYARLVLQSGQVAPETLLAGTGLTIAALGEMEFVPWQNMALLFRNYGRARSSPGWTSELGARLNIASHGPLGFAALSAPTLGEALEIMATYYPVRNSAMRAATHLENDRFFLTVEDLTGDPEFASWIQEIVLAVVESLLTTILGHPVGPNVVIAFSHPPPHRHAELVAGYNARVLFNAQASTLSVPAIWRQLPSPLYEEAIFRDNIAHCEHIIAGREAHASAGQRVRTLLGHYFENRQGPLEPAPTLEQVALRLHLAPRTLIRHLQREHTSFRDILENLRREHASRLLRDARLNIAEVAEILGYREPANFGRAFRRWFGMSPAAWRRR